MLEVTSKPRLSLPKTPSVLVFTNIGRATPQTRSGGRPEAPEQIHVEFLDRDTRPTGLGEIGNPFIAAAVANAFYALTGKRLYHMPFTPTRVLAALAA